jgi:single-strand DNA-binding protein
VVNSYTCKGTLGDAPEVRYSTKGTPWATFSVAVRQPWRSKAKDQDPETYWIDCKCFGKLAEFLGPLGKGDSLMLSGYLAVEKWEDKKTGDKRKKTVLMVDDALLLTRPPARTAPARRDEEPEYAQDPRHTQDYDV